MSVYLDYNATAPIRPEAARAAVAALDIGANPSSIHAAGRAARGAVERARAEVAALVGATPEMTTFVSGGAEANALAIESAVAAGFTRVIVGATEHDTVLEAARTLGAIEIWPVGADGVADLGWLESALASGPPALVCLMAANNETGVIQPMGEAASLVREAGGWLHVDAVQAAGKIPMNLERLGADTLALSAHKVGGPQGAGAVIAAARAPLTRRLHGGGQERGRRAGTENVSGIAGFWRGGQGGDDAGSGARSGAWRDELAAKLARRGAVVLGASAPRLPQTLCVATPGFSSEVQVMALDLAGIMVSAGSACSSGKVKASRVVEAMGHADLAAFSIRISGGWASTRADWLTCGEAWLEAFERRQARAREFA